jgi:hypothetical protein
MDDYRIDAVGQKLRVGDTVAFSKPRRSAEGVTFLKAKVIELLPKSVRLQTNVHTHRLVNGKTVKQLSHVVKLFGENPEIKLM